jgi:hypothetical protein
MWIRNYFLHTDGTFLRVLDADFKKTTKFSLYLTIFTLTSTHLKDLFMYFFKTVKKTLIFLITQYSWITVIDITLIF